jgi:hypothetical protein
LGSISILDSDTSSTVGEALESLCDSIRPLSRSAGVGDDNDSVYNFFISRVKQNLHIVMAFLPVGEALSHQAVRFQALINCPSSIGFTIGRIGR